MSSLEDLIDCPPPARERPDLAESINARLLDWAKEIEIYKNELPRLHSCNLGSLVVLTQPNSDDADRLFAAAQCAAAGFALDDYYTDDFTVNTRLTAIKVFLSQSSLDPACLPPPYAGHYQTALTQEPILRAWRSAMDHLASYATAAQMHRFRHENANLCAAVCAEAAWRLQRQPPATWLYLASRQINSFMTSMSLIDVIDGYELPTSVYAHPKVRQTMAWAANAATLINDLYSTSKESREPGTTFNLPTLIAAEKGWSREASLRHCIKIHNQMVRAFKSDAAKLASMADPDLHRFLKGLWSWMRGNKAWHSMTPRYSET
ncbi:Camphene synthase [Streptomyces sp. KLMMK]|uniref:terpene synthase family protein n=1 Tax=Streptomyces sp. KLMMK TaxID=3109353 RepID=UPI00300959E7